MTKLIKNVIFEKKYLLFICFLGQEQFQVVSSDVGTAV